MSADPLTGTITISTLSRHRSTIPTSTHSHRTRPTSIPNVVSAYTTVYGTSTVVHVVIQTTVTIPIPNISRYYKIPVSSFHPHYTALADGSLISSVYNPNLQVSEGWLVMGGALTVYFLMSTCNAIRYTRIVNAKNKALFYMLVLSQAIGIFVSVFFVIADFSIAVDCTATGMLKKGGVLISTTLLVPGILGAKAYKCLGNAGFVIVVLVLMRATIIAVSGIVLAEYQGGRRFTGTCETVKESPLLPLSIILQFVEACFICFCFIWAVYRSYHGPADHARLSLIVDEEDETSSVGTNEKDDEHRPSTSRRGWWDYVPHVRPETPKNHHPQHTVRSFLGDWFSRFRQWWSGESMLPSTVFQRPSGPRDMPLSQPPRISSVSSVGPRISTNREGFGRPSRAISPPPPSVMDRLIRFVPSADLIRKMLKNELMYTIFITTVLFIISVVMLVGVTQQLLLGANSWIMLDWLIISMCTMHSFSRVAHRHEREAWLQDQANWSLHTAKAEDETVHRPRPRQFRRAWSPGSTRSSWRHRYREPGESDGRRTVGLYRSTELSESPLSLSRPSHPSRSASLHRPRSDAPSSNSRSTSIASLPMPSMDSFFKTPPPPPPRPSRGSLMVAPSSDNPFTNASQHQVESHAFLPYTGYLPVILGSSGSKRLASPPPPLSPHSSHDWDPENSEPPDPERTL